MVRLITGIDPMDVPYKCQLRSLSPETKDVGLSDQQALVYIKGSPLLIMLGTLPIVVLALS
jgi:hypothetical protein